MKLSDSFQLSRTDTETHSWTLLSHDENLSPVESFAKMVAEKIVEHLCRGCPQHYHAWKQRVENGTPLPAASNDALTAFIRMNFGLPAAPPTQDHIEGFIAEHLWYFLNIEITELDIVRIESPGFMSTEKGGDGLIVHRQSDGSLMFRLWEIKKNTSQTFKVSQTVTNCYGQLHAKGVEYLARYTAIGQEYQNVQIATFFSKLIELWIEASPQASAGVSIATSTALAPKRCFSTFGKQFPQFIDPNRLRGMLTAIDDFTAFTNKVKEYVWKGL